jgi:nucleotide-binding universal stress UspA family protein
METILLLTNFTETSSRAIEGFMKVFGPKLVDTHHFILLNAWRKPRTGQSQMHNLDDYLQEISDQELKREKSRISQLLPGISLSIHAESKHGDIVAVLNMVCETNEPDLIVMGTKGSSMFRELVAGSTTGRIVRKTKAPILLIPEWHEFTYPQRIVLASEMKECSNEEDFKKLTDIVRLFMSEFIILHVFREEKPATDRFEKCMKKYLEGINHDFQYVQHLQVEEAITEFCSNMKADLLAMICHNEHLLVKLLKQSISEKMTERAELPMLLIHEG